MGLIDNLVNVKISISEGVGSSASFSNILLVGNAPESKVVEDVAVYASADEIMEAGWSEDSEVYKAAVVAFMNGADKLYVAAKTEDDTLTAILNKANEKDGWYGIALAGFTPEDNKTVASWAESNGKLFGFTVDCTDEIVNPVPTTYSYAFGIGTRKSDNNAYLAVAYLAKAMTHQAGSETWAYKTLSGVEYDDFTTVEIAKLKTVGLNYYVMCAGKAITLEGKTTSGEWIDVIRFRDWLLNDMQTRIYNLFIKNAKVPYTDAGIALIQNQIIASLKEGQSVGGIAQTVYDDEGNEIPGFTTSVPTSANVGDANKATRTLAGCTFTARLANAIHIVEIRGTLSA